MLKKQSGAVLVVSLIILVVLTVLVISGTQSTLMQEKMTSSIRDVHISLEVAESGLRDAEDMIDTLTGVTTFTNSGGLYGENNGPEDVFSDDAWEKLTPTGTKEIITISAKTETLKKRDSNDDAIVAEYFVEYLGVMKLDEDLSGLNMTGYGETTGGNDVHGFKIVSRSTGRDGHTERIIVGYYAKSF